MINSGLVVQKLIQKTFDIREGEFKISMLLQASIFLIIATLLVVKPIVNAMFIDEFGVQNLPGAYIVVAIIAVIGSLLYARALNRNKLITIILGTLIVSAIGLVAFGVLLILNITINWVIYLFYVWTSIFAVLSASQFWILANVVFNVREAKRVFSFIGAGAIAGGIAGGYLTSLLVPILGIEWMLFVAAFFIMLCIPINLSVWRMSAQKYTLYRRKKSIPNFGEGPLKMILKSKLLTLLAAIIGMSVLVAKLVDYQFSAIAALHIPDPDELAQFFAFWLSNLNLVSLLIQIFLTRWLVGTYGVGTSLLFLPVGVALGAIITFFIPELWSVVLLKSVDGSLKQSLNKSATELLGLPVPFEIKNKTKTFIDVVVDSLATGIAGFILIFLVHGLDLNSRFVSAVIFALVIVWLWLAYLVRAEYLKSFQLLASEKLNLKSEKKKENPASVLNSIVRVFNGDKPTQIVYMLDQIHELRDKRFIGPMKVLLESENDEILFRVIRNLRNYKEAVIKMEAVKLFMHRQNEQVRVEAFLYLLKFSDNDHLTFLEEYLNHHDPYVAGAALLALAEESKSSFTLRMKSELVERVKKRHNTTDQIQDEALMTFQKKNLLKIMATLNDPEFYPEISKRFDDTDPQIVRQAIESAAQTLNNYFIPRLINLLSQKEFRSDARLALYQFGIPIIDVLAGSVKTKSIEIDALRFVPSVIEQFQSPKAVSSLFTMLDDEDLSIRLEAVRSLNKIRIAFPNLDMRKRDVIDKINAESKIYIQTLNAMHTQVIINYHRKSGTTPDQIDLEDARKSLLRLLESRLESHLERIFGLLGLRYPPEEMDKAFEAIQSGQTDARINAIEFLDNLLEADLKRILIPIVEMSIIDTVSEAVLRDMNLKVLSEFECFTNILDGNDTKLKLAVLYLIGQLKDKKYEAVLKKMMDNPNLKIRDFATQALQEMRA